MTGATPGVVEIVGGAQHEGVVWWLADFQEQPVALARPAPAKIELGVVAAGDTSSGVLEVSCETKSDPVKGASARDPWITLGKPGPYVAGKPYRIPYTVTTQGLAADGDKASSIVLEMAEGVVPEKLEVPVTLHTGAAMPKGKDFDELSKVHDTLLISHEQGYGQLRKNRSITGAPVNLGGKRHATGLGSHAAQKTSYFIGGKGYKVFVATVGLDETSKTGHGQAAVQFRVEVDGVERYRTPVMREDSPPITIVVDGLAKARTLTLYCDSVGDVDFDHADWAEARLYR